MLRMRPDDPVPTSVDFSSNVTMVDGSMEADNFRKRPGVDYSEILQFGKRKFHHVDESSSLLNFVDAGGIRTTTDDEAGLSLLFAASLLQQGGHLTATSMDSTTPTGPSVVDAATTMNFYGASNGLGHPQPFPVAMYPVGVSGRPRTECFEIAAASKTSDSIEPTVNDGRLLRKCFG